MLYIFINSPFMCDIQSLLRIVKRGDELLFISDAVIMCVVDSCFLKRLISLEVMIYVLENDVLARGLSFCIADQVRVIDYIGFVKLTEKHILCVSW